MRKNLWSSIAREDICKAARELARELSRARRRAQETNLPTTVYSMLLIKCCTLVPASLSVAQAKSMRIFLADSAKSDQVTFAAIT